MVEAVRTTSLLLSPYKDSDAQALFGFMSIPSAMQHTYIAPTVEHCSTRLKIYETMRSTHGFAPWVARLHEGGEPIGWGGLSIDPEEPEWGLEVSYAFSPIAWGKGYATELVQASLACAFGPLAVSVVHAFAKKQNTASVRVLEKCGFAYLCYEPRLERSHYLVKAPGAA
jgi:RimJ/RimL family protein N-acetyltransferase